MANFKERWLAVAFVWAIGAIFLLSTRYLYNYDMDMFFQPIIIFQITFTLAISIANGIEGTVDFFARRIHSRRQ